MYLGNRRASYKKQHHPQNGETLHYWELLQFLFEGCCFTEEKPGALGSPDDALRAGKLMLTTKSCHLQARQDFRVTAEKKFSGFFTQLLEVMKGTWCRL